MRASAAGRDSLRDPHHHEFAGRHLGPGERERAFRLRQRREIVGRAGVEQRVLAERSRRHQADHLAPHHRLGPALARLRRVLHLFAHRDLEALADQALEIALGAHHRHPAHRHVLALVEAAPGQCDVERVRGRARIVEEEFVEIPHPVEEEVVRVGALDLLILRHHRRRRLDTAGARPAPPHTARAGRRGVRWRLGVLGHDGTLAQDFLFSLRRRALAPLDRAPPRA